MANASTSHPEPEQLRRFGLGQLPREEAHRIESHVAGCDQCAATLEQVQADTLVSLLHACPVARETPVQTALESGSSTGVADPPELVSIPEPLIGHPRYRVLRLLGRGGMGEVYLAKHLVLDRLVALKVIKPSLLGDGSAVRRFQQEMRSVAKLAHPNIVQAHDAEAAGGVHFLVMEFVEGESLGDHLKAHGPLPIGKACDCVHQARVGVAARTRARHDAPRHQATQPDAHPPEEAALKALDFGKLARLAAEQSLLEVSAGSGLVLGTADYMAPEQAGDPRSADIRSDVCSLGATLYHLLAGQPPYPGGSAAEKIRRRQSEDAPGLSSVRPEVPARLAAVVARMLARDPADRYQTPGEVAAALGPWCQQPGGRRFRRAWLASLAALALLSGTAAVLWFRPSERPAVEGLEEKKSSEGEHPDLPDKLGPMLSLPVLSQHRDATVMFSPDSRLTLSLADAPGVWGAWLHVTETATGRPIVTIGRPTEGFCCALFAADGKTVVCPMVKPGLSGYLFRRWDLLAGRDELFDKVADPGGWPVFSCLSANGKRLSLLSLKDARVVDLQSGKVLLRIEPSSSGKRLIAWPLLLHDGKRVVTYVLEAKDSRSPWTRKEFRIDDLETRKTTIVPLSREGSAVAPFFLVGNDRVGCWHVDREGVYPEYRRAATGTVLHRGPVIGKAHTIDSLCVSEGWTKGLCAVRGPADSASMTCRPAGKSTRANRSARSATRSFPPTGGCSLSFALEHTSCIGCPIQGRSSLDLTELDDCRHHPIPLTMPESVRRNPCDASRAPQSSWPSSCGMRSPFAAWPVSASGSPAWATRASRSRPGTGASSTWTRRPPRAPGATTTEASLRDWDWKPPRWPAICKARSWRSIRRTRVNPASRSFHPAGLSGQAHAPNGPARS